jgi:hypothetical protein
MKSYHHSLGPGFPRQNFYSPPSLHVHDAKMDRIICASRNEYVVLSECCPERPYIEVQVPADATSVEEIALRITSHDQGRFSPI